MPDLRPEFASRSSVDLGLRNSHHRSLARPMRHWTHGPRSQQMLPVWPEIAAHALADLELQSSHHPSHHPALQCPRSISQDCGKRPMCGLYVVYIHELILNSRRVTTTVWSAPGKSFVTKGPPGKSRVPKLGQNMFLAVTSFRKPCPKDRWARNFKSPTLESSSSYRVSPQPLGSDMLT